MAFITSQGVLDSPKNEAIRRYLMQNSRLISALRLPSGMFSENAGTEVGSDLIVLQKQSGKTIGEGIEQQFVASVSVPIAEGSSVVFKHNSLFDGEWKDIAHRTIATERTMAGTHTANLHGSIASMAALMIWRRVSEHNSPWNLSNALTESSMKLAYR